MEVTTEAMTEATTEAATEAATGRPPSPQTVWPTSVVQTPNFRRAGHPKLSAFTISRSRGTHVLVLASPDSLPHCR